MEKMETNAVVYTAIEREGDSEYYVVYINDYCFYVNEEVYAKVNKALAMGVLN